MPRQCHWPPRRSQKIGCACASACSHAQSSRRPPPRIVVAAGVDEREVVAVGDVEPLDAERVDLTSGPGNSLSQPNGISPRLAPSRAVPAATSHVALHDGPGCDADGIVGWRTLGGMRQPMPHVQQRLLVHRLVLEDGVHRLGAVQQRVPRLVQRGLGQCLHHPCIGRADEPVHGVAVGPGERRRVVPVLVGIDAAGEQPLERFVDAGPAERHA